MTHPNHVVLSSGSSDETLRDGMSTVKSQAPPNLTSDARVRFIVQPLVTKPETITGFQNHGSRKTGGVAAVTSPPEP